MRILGWRESQLSRLTGWRIQSASLHRLETSLDWSVNYGKILTGIQLMRRLKGLALFGAMEKHGKTVLGREMNTNFCVASVWRKMANGDCCCVWGLAKFILLLILIGNVIIMKTQPKMISSFWNIVICPHDVLFQEIHSLTHFVSACRTVTIPPDRLLVKFGNQWNQKNLDIQTKLTSFLVAG